MAVQAIPIDVTQARSARSSSALLNGCGRFTARDCTPQSIWNLLDPRGNFAGVEIVLVDTAIAANDGEANPQSQR